MYIGSFVKQPSDELDYDINYADWIVPGDVILGATANVTPAGLAVAAPVVIDGGTRVKLWVHGGVTGTTYKIEVTATTTAGRVKQDELRFKVKDY